MKDVLGKKSPVKQHQSHFSSSLSSSTWWSNMFGGGTRTTRDTPTSSTANRLRGRRRGKKQALLHPSLNISHQSYCSEVQVDKTVLVRGPPIILLMQKPCTQPSKLPCFSQVRSGRTAQRRCLGPAGSPIAFTHSSWVGNRYGFKSPPLRS